MDENERKAYWNQKWDEAAASGDQVASKTWVVDQLAALPEPSAGGRTPEVVVGPDAMPTGANVGLPSGDFDSEDGDVLKLDVKASGYTTGAPSTIGYNVKVDGATVGQVKIFTNESGSHKGAYNFFVISGLAAGTHTVTFTAIAGTQFNVDDFFTVVVS